MAPDQYGYLKIKREKAIEYIVVGWYVVCVLNTCLNLNMENF